jgi:hypothetical protein
VNSGRSKIQKTENAHYTQKQEIDQEKVFRPEQEGKPLEVTKKLEKLGKQQLSEEHFEDLKEKRGLSKETVEQYIRPVNQEVIESLEEEFESETLAKSGWYKYKCQACDSVTTFEQKAGFTEHLEEEHGRKDFDKYSEWLYRLIPENGYLIKYSNIGSKGELVYANIRDRNPEDKSYKYCQPHLSSVEARKSYKQGIFPAFEEIGGETLVITEGEFKSLALKEQDWDSLAIAGVNLSQSNLDRLSRICSQYDQVVYVVDDDMGGLLSVPTMTGEMQSRNQRIQVQVSKQKDIDDKHAEGEKFELQPEKPVKLLKKNLERLDRKEHAISKYGKPEDILEVFFQTVQGLKRSKQESKIKSVIEEINETLEGNFDKNTVKSELTDYREQFKRQKRNQKREKEKPTEEVNSFQETIEVDGVQIALNPVEYVNVIDHIKTFTEIKKNSNGNVKPDKKFKVYEIAFDKGTEEETFKLLTDPYRKLNLGDKYLPLKQADLSREDFNKWIKQKFRKAQEDGYDGSFQDFKKERFEDNTFEIADHINQKSIKKIKEMDNQVIREEIVEKYLNNGYSYDKKLTKLNHPKIIRHNKSKVDAEDVMPYNPHSAYITDTKIGKSYNSDRVGVKMDKMSSSGLLGYASADDLRKGTLDGMEEPFFADEIRHGKEDNIGDKLLTIFEQGSSRISKGQKDMKPEFYGSFTYMSNPKKSDDNKDSVDYFMDFVEKLGSNNQALGSRLGVLLFDMGKMDKARGTPLPKEERQKLETVVEWVKQEVAEEYTDIEKELQEWLHQEYPESYKNRINGWKPRIISEKACEFLEGHEESYKHARGQALRMAVYKNIGKVLKKEYSIEEIREDADDKFRELMDINLFSIGNLSNSLSDKNRVIQHKQALLEAEETLYMKLFVKAVISQAKANEKIFQDIEPVPSLQPVFKQIKTELGVEQDSKYWKFSEIRYKLEDNLGRSNKRLEDRYGLTLTRDGDNLFVKISNSNKFKVYPEVKKGCVPKFEQSSPMSPKSPEGSEETTPPSPSKDSSSNDKEEPSKEEGGGEKEKSRGDIGDIGDRNEKDSVIISKEPETGEEISEDKAVEILEIFQKEGPLKKASANNKTDGSIDDFSGKVSDLKKIGLLSYDRHTHQYSLTDEGKGLIQNEGLESVFSQEEVKN